MRGTALCPDGLMAYAEFVFAQLGITVKDANRCTVVAFGTSDLLLDTKPVRGTIDGHLYVVVNSDKTNLTDAAELVVMTGEFSDTIEVTDPVLITLTNGTFKPTAVVGADPKTMCPGLGICKAVFTGTFRLPFEVHDVAANKDIAVYKKDSGDLVWVHANERALGDPTVRLEITFVDD